MDLLLLSIVSGLLFSISGETISGSIPDDLNWLAIEKHVGFLTPYNKISTLFLTWQGRWIMSLGRETGLLLVFFAQQSPSLHPSFTNASLLPFSFV